MTYVSCSMPKSVNAVYGLGKVHATYGGIQCLPFRMPGTFMQPKPYLFFYRAPCESMCLPFWELNPGIVPIKPPTPTYVAPLGRVYPLVFIQGGDVAGDGEEGGCQFG
jgi:hypothetical protein